MLKLVGKNSDEHRIYDALLNSGPYSDPKTFPCVLPALSILNTPHEYVIVSMPMYASHRSALCVLLTQLTVVFAVRWGNPLHLGDIQTTRECLRFMECTLRVRTSCPLFEIISYPYCSGTHVPSWSSCCASSGSSRFQTCVHYSDVCTAGHF